MSNNRENIERKLNENSSDLNGMRLKALFSVILFFVGIIISFFIIKSIAFTIVILLVLSIVMVFQNSKYIKKNNEKYDEVVKNTLHEFNSDLEYLP